MKHKGIRNRRSVHIGIYNSLELGFQFKFVVAGKFESPGIGNRHVLRNSIDKVGKVRQQVA